MDNNILEITDKAADQIKKIINESEKKVLGVKVGVDKTGCSGYAYKLEYAEDSDTQFDIVSSKGVKVFIDPKAVMFLIGSEMDYVTDKLSSRFTFNNPNEKSTCGCGESFNV